MFYEHQNMYTTRIKTAIVSCIVKLKYAMPSVKLHFTLLFNGIVALAKTSSIYMH